MVNKIAKYTQQARNVLTTVTFKQSSITFFGTFANAALGAIFYILTARFLGPASFGLMSVALAVMTLLADLGDLGTDTGIVRFVAKYITIKPLKAKRFLKLGLKIKILVGITVFVVGLFLADWVASIVFQKPELANPLRISFLGVGFLLLFTFATHSLQAYQKFWHWSGVQILTNGIRVAIVIILLLLGTLNLESTIVAYIAMPAIGFFVGLMFIDRSFLKVDGERSVADEFFQFNKWVAVFTFFTAFSSRLDTFITARLLTATQVGLYSAANQLVKIVPQINSALGTVMAPKFASMNSIEDFIKYFKKTQFMVSGIAILGILSIPVVILLIPLIFGQEYINSGPVFVILLFAMLVFLVSVPVHSAILYYFSYPKLLFYLSIAQLLIITTLGWVFISNYGVIGAAITVLIGALFSFTASIFWLIRKIYTQRS